MECENRSKQLLKKCCIACLTEKGHLHGDPVTISCYSDLIDNRVHQKPYEISIVFCKYCQDVLEQFKDFKLICKNSMYELEKRLHELKILEAPLEAPSEIYEIIEIQTKMEPEAIEKMEYDEVDVVAPKYINKNNKKESQVNSEPKILVERLISDQFENEETLDEEIEVKNENDMIVEELVDEFADFPDEVGSSDENYEPEQEKPKKIAAKRGRKRGRQSTKKKLCSTKKTGKPRTVNNIKKMMEKALDKMYTNTRGDQHSENIDADNEEEEEKGGWWDDWWQQEQNNAAKRAVKQEEYDDDESSIPVKKKRKINVNKKSRKSDSSSDEERPQESNEPIWCNFCNEIFPSIHSEPNNYSTHVSTVHGTINDDGSIECGICKKRMRSRDTFRRHFQNHRVFQTPKKCPKAGCPETFTVAKAYKAHKKQHNIRPAQCPHCDFTCKSKDFIRSHILIKHENGVWCKYCRHGIPWDRWEEHEKMEIEKKAKKPAQSFICELCGMTFKSKESRRVHMRGLHAENECACEQCGSTFRSMLHLRRHVLYNHAEKKYECDICKKKIRQKSHLKKHMEFNHVADRYTTCDVCGKSVYKRGLAYHIKTIHAEHKLYECHFCKRRFGVESSLRQHLGKKHGSEKPLPCPLCPRGYFSIQEYRKHMQNAHDDPVAQKQDISERIIKNEDGTFELGNIVDMSCMFGDFACKICGKKYNILYSLRDHLHQHPECMPYRCDRCDKVYFLENQLSKHYEKSHNQKFNTQDEYGPKRIKHHSIAEKVLEYTIVTGDIQTCTRKERVPRKKYPQRRKMPPDHTPRPNPTRMKNIKMLIETEPSTSYEEIEILDEAQEEAADVIFESSLLRNYPHNTVTVYHTPNLF